MTTSTSALLERAVSLLRGVYGAVDNAQRRASTEELMQLEQMLTPAQARDVALDLLRVTTHGAAVQAYGAVLLRRAVRAAHVAVREVPYDDLLTWYVHEPTLGRLLLSDLVELLVDCLVYADDGEHTNDGSSYVSRTLQVLCSSNSSSSTTVVTEQLTRSLVLLHAIVSSLLEPDFARVPRERAAVLRRRVVGEAEALLCYATRVLYACFVQSGGAAATQYAPATEPCVDACVGVLATLAPHVSVRLWQAVALPETMAGLLRWQPARRRALVLTASLLRCGHSSDYGTSATTGSRRVDDADTHAARDVVLQQLLQLVLDGVPACVAAFHGCCNESSSCSNSCSDDNADGRACELGVLEEVLELLDELPRPLLQVAGRALCTSLLHVLSMPSLQFANAVCSLWLRLDASVWGTTTTSTSEAATAAAGVVDGSSSSVSSSVDGVAIDVVAVYAALRPFVPKQQLHPVCGTHALGRWLSEQQLGFAGMYEATFADFRKNCGALLELLARAHAARTNEYIAVELLERGLCSAAGGVDDARTPRGYVTQASATYRTWESVEFLLSHLAEAFRVCVTAVPRCVSALLARQPRDAVLLPTFLNMLACFWRCRDDAATPVWEGTVQLLLAYIDPDTASPQQQEQQAQAHVCNNNNNSSSNSLLWLRSAYHTHDPDEVAARRRVHTLLVTLGVEHAHRLGTPLVQRLLARLYALLLHSRGAERALLCEAMASLTTALPVADAEAQLRTLLQPVLELLQRLLANEAREQHAFDTLLLLPTTARERDARDTLRDGVTTLAAVLRRCRVSAYVMEAALRVVDVAAQVATRLHGIDVSALPPYMAHVLDLEDDQRAQYLPGQSRPSIVAATTHAHGNHHNNSNNNNNCSGQSLAVLRAARAAVLSLRLAVYQIFGALSPLLPAERFAPVLQSVRSAHSALPLHAMRTLTLQCLLPIAEQHTTLLPDVLDVLDGFFAARARVVQDSSNNNNNNSNNSRRAREQDEVIETKQWAFYARDVRTFVQRSVLDAQRWRTQPALLACVARLAAHMLDAGVDTRGVVHQLLALVELRADSVVTTTTIGAAATSNVADVQASVFARLVHYVVHSSDGALPPRERDSIAYALTEPYLRRYPTLAPALQAGAAGGGGNAVVVSQAQLDVLHAQLTLANRHAVQRRYVKDFVLALAQQQRQRQHA